MKIKIICGAVIVKNDKFAIVQEAQGAVRGLWNIPAGHLDENENIHSGAMREAKEETGLDIELEGLIGIYQYKSPLNNNVIGLYFQASTSGGKLNHNPEEILDSKWVTFEEFLNYDNKIIRAPHLKEVVKDYLKQGSNKNLIHIASI